MVPPLRAVDHLHGTGGYGPVPSATEPPVSATETTSWFPVVPVHGGYDPDPYGTGSYDAVPQRSAPRDAASYEPVSYGASAYDASAYDASAYDASAYDASAYDASAYGAVPADPAPYQPAPYVPASGAALRKRSAKANSGRRNMSGNAAAVLTKPAFRKIEWLERDIEVERRPDGVIVLKSRIPLQAYEKHIPASLAKWARQAPERIWLAQRGGPDRQWRKLSYGEAKRIVDALTQGLLDLGSSRAARSRSSPAIRSSTR